MVRFILEPELTSEEDRNQAPKPQNSRVPHETFDSNLTDLSLADSFLDFDSIKEFFEDSPNPGTVGLDQFDFGGFEERMEKDDKGFCVETQYNGPIICGSNPISEDPEHVVNEANPVEAGSVCLVKTEEEKLKLEGEGNLGCSIEEDMKSVSLIGGLNSITGDRIVVKSEAFCDGGTGKVSLVVPDESSVKREVNDEAEMGNISLPTGSSLVKGCGVNTRVMNDEDDSESDSESVSEMSSSSSSSSSSASSDDDDDDEREESDVKKQGEEIRADVITKVNEVDDLEEGEIRDGNGEAMVDGTEEEEEEEEGDDVGKMDGWRYFDFDGIAEDEDDAGFMGQPIRSINELKVLPPVPPVDVTLEPHHMMLPVGVVLSIVGAKVIVEGMEKHNPLNEGSILWLTEKRSPLGLVDEIFGPVKNPYYVIRYNSESEVPTGIHEGTVVSFVPEFANHVLNDKNLYKKGYDASGENDEEAEEAEFSDDEKEAEYKRMLKMSKRGMNDQIVEKKKNHRKKVKNRDRKLKANNPSTQQTRIGTSQLPPNQNQNVSPVGASISHGNCSSSSAIGQGCTGGTVFFPPFPPVAESTGTFYQPNVSSVGALMNHGSCSSSAIGQDCNGGTAFFPLFPPMAQNTGTFLSPMGGGWASGVTATPQQQPPNVFIPGGLPANNMPWHAQNQIRHPCQMSMPNGMAFQQQFNPSQGSLPNAVLPSAGGQLNFFSGPTSWPGVVGQNCFDQTNVGMSFQVQPPRPIMNTMNLNVGDQGIASSGQLVKQNCNFQLPAFIPGNMPASQQFNVGASSGRGRKPYNQRGGGFAGGRGRRPSK